MYTKIIVASLIVSIVLGTSAYYLDLSFDLSTLPAPYPMLSWYVLSLLSGLAASFWVSKASTASAAPARGSRRTSSSRAASSGSVSASKETGSVKWFSPSKGFGFITRDNGEDIFVHFRSILGKGHRVLREGQRVEFAVTQGTKGLQAEEVSTVK